MWLDNQAPGWEGSMDATRIVHIQAWLDIWLTDAASGGVILKLPFAWAFALINLFDGGTPAIGNPNDFTPVSLPNLFQRTFGRREQGSISPDSPNPSPFDDGLRVLQRGTMLIGAGTGDDLTMFVRKAYWNSRKGFTIGRHQCLALVMNAYNTHADDNHILGARLFTHFGYRHFTRG